MLLAKQRHRRTTLGTPGPGAGRLLDATVGHGYRPWLAAIWLAMLLTAGTAVYAIDRPHALAGGPCRHSMLSPTPSTCSSPSAHSSS